MSSAAEVLLGSDVAVCSFDVFDTLLYRQTGMPETVFDLMEKEWSERFGCAAPERFAHLRAGAERQAQQRHGRDTVTIEEIYEGLRFLLGPAGPSNEEISSFELDTERQVLSPVAAGAELVDKARKSGKRIIFTSDTYLPESFLSESLQRHGFMEKGDRLYASAAKGASKATGELFQLVARDLGITPSLLLHIGNSEEVDVKRARSNGWSAQHFGVADWNKREWTLWHLSQAGRGLSPHVHAAARNARLNAKDGIENLEVFNIGAAVAGPVLVSFAEWVLEQARARGVDELFFLSRDAQVVFEICRILGGQAGDSRCPKLTYVYGSRQVWAFYALQSLEESKQAEFFADKISSSATSMADCADLLQLAEHAGVKKLVQQLDSKPGSAPDRAQRLAFYEALLKDRSLAEVLRSQLAEHSQAYMDYLATLPVRPETSCAVIDIGWSGMWTEIVGAMFKQAGAADVIGLQMGRVQRKQVTWGIPVECFLFDEPRMLGVSDPPGWITPLLEVFCGADHGRVTGIEDSGGRKVPIESTRKFGGMPEEDFRAFRAGVCGFAREWVPLCEGVGDVVGEPASLIEILRQFWSFPSAAEARFVQGVDVGMAPNADSDRHMLRPYRPSDIVRLITTGHLPGFEPLWWHRGALATTSKGLAVGMAAVSGLVGFAKQILKGRAARNLLPGTEDLREYAKGVRWLMRV